MFEGPLQTNLSSSIPATDTGYNIFTYARWHHCLAWMLPFEWLNASILMRVFKFNAQIRKIP